jgi:hypothetical protein
MKQGLQERAATSGGRVMREPEKTGPKCSVRPHTDVAVYERKPARAEKREKYCAMTFDKDGDWFRRSMMMFQQNPRRLVEKWTYEPGQEKGDECWESEGGAWSVVRRTMADDMGLYPAYTEEDLEEYDADQGEFMSRRLRCACRWGTPNCVRPSHAVVGEFVGGRRKDWSALDDEDE